MQKVLYVSNKVEHNFSTKMGYKYEDKDFLLNQTHFDWFDDYLCCALSE